MIIDWLEEHIDDTIRHTGNGKEVHFNCPVCDETRHRMYVSLETGLVYCHNCQFKGTAVQLIQYVEGVSYSRAKSIFKDIKGSVELPEELERDKLEDLFMGDFRKDLDKRAIPLPEEYTPLDPKHTNPVTRMAIKYLHSRGITDRQITKYNMGFCMSGEYQNRVIIPITENGELRFWVARAISKNAFRKEMSPTNEDYQISKSEVIFNIDQAARLYHSCVISEGIFDALSWGSMGISLLGKALYTEQVNILLDYRELLSEGVYVALDWDAKNYATKIAEELSPYFKVKLVNIPKEDDDPNNFLQKHGRAALLGLLDTAEEYTELDSVRRLFT